MQRKIVAVERKIQDIRAQVDSRSSILLHAKLLHAQSLVAENIINRSGITAPLSVAVSIALQKLPGIGKATQVELLTIRLDPVAGASKTAKPDHFRLQKEPVLIELQGKFRNELRFLRKITRVPGLVLRLDSVSFRKSQGENTVHATGRATLLSIDSVQENKQ